MDHFYADPLSILSSIVTDNEDQVQNMITNDHLECVRMQKSFIRFAQYIHSKLSLQGHVVYVYLYPSVFRSYVEALALENPTEARQLVTSDNHLRSRLPYFIHRLHDYHGKFAFAFEVLDTMQKQVSDVMNTTSLKKARKTIYLYALGRSIVETDFYQGLVKMLRYDRNRQRHRAHPLSLKYMFLI